MTHATLVWSIWQALLTPFPSAFTRPGHRRFCEWITALALNVEEHTITQSVLAIERPADWKAMETFAETGAWPIDAVARTLARRVGTAPGRLWYGYHVSAVDDTTPRSIVPGSTSGGPAPFMSTPPGAPIGRAPSGRTTGWSSGPCSTTLISPPGSCPCPGGSTSARPSCPRDPGSLDRRWRFGPSANWPSSCCGSTPAPWMGSTWPSSMAVSR
jgi:hypothetical protein